MLAMLAMLAMASQGRYLRRIRQREKIQLCDAGIICAMKMRVSVSFHHRNPSTMFTVWHFHYLPLGCVRTWGSYPNLTMNHDFSPPNFKDKCRGEAGISVKLSVCVYMYICVYRYICHTPTSFLYKMPTLGGCTKGFCSRAFLGYMGMTRRFGIL